MLKLTRQSLANIFFFTAACITIGIAFLSLMPSSFVTVKVNQVDKIEHLIAYFFLSLSWLLAFGFSEKKRLNIRILVSCIVFGIVIEVLQKTVAINRTASTLDVVANSVGIFLGYMFFLKIKKKNYLFYNKKL